MNTNSVFRFEISDQDEFDKRILNSNLNPRLVDQLDILGHNFVEQSKEKLDYQLNQQLRTIGQRYTNQFNQQLNHRLNQHLSIVNQSTNKKLNSKIRTSSRSHQNKLVNLFFYLFNYYKSIFAELNTNIIYLVNFIIYLIQFLLADIFHYFIFRYLLTSDYQRIFLIRWLQKVTNNSLVRNGSLVHSKDFSHNNQLTTGENVKFGELFKNGKLLCGLVDHLNENACPRYDLLDSTDIDTNLELAYRLILTHYGLDDKISIVNSNYDEVEQKFINLISEIRYLEVKRELCSRYEIGGAYINCSNSLVLENYLIRGMGIVASVKNKVSFFNIFYFKTVDLVVEISGPNSYGCERIKLDNDGLKSKAHKNLKLNGGQRVDETCNKEPDINRIPLKFVIKKQLIEISYLPIDSGIHKIEIVHQGKNILHSPYILKVDDCDL